MNRNLILQFYSERFINGTFTRGKRLFFCLIFLGLSFSSFAQNSSANIKIGFLIRDQKDSAVMQAAQLAISQANSEGSFEGKQFELITKYCDGPWGITSKQVVELIYDEEVSLVVDALDGRNAHLAEQVTAKSHVVLLSALSSDPTLSRAYVPWYYRLVPDDKQQSELLIKEIYGPNKSQNVVIISLDDYDGKKSAETLEQLAVKKGYQKPEIRAGLSENELIKHILQNPWEAVVLAGSKDNTHMIIKKIHGIKPELKLYAFLNLLNFVPDYHADLSEIVTFPYLPEAKNAKYRSFIKSFENKYGRSPNPVLAYVYDGILLSVAAVRQFGSDTETLRKNFKSVKYTGVTGEVLFDSMGNRITKDD